MQRFQSLSAVLTLLSYLLVGALPARAQASQPLEVVAFGDSLSAGLGVSASDSFPEQLQAALRGRGYDVSVANAGVSGDTTTGGLARLDWSVPDSADLVILELGANDALRGVSPDIVRRNLDAMLERLGARARTRVLLAGMIAPPNMGGGYGDAFNRIFPELARKHGVALYPFFLDGVASVSDLNQDDAMHPNARGVAVIVERILPAVERELRALGAAPGAG
jgi:acyl-CoA thioesterase I